MNLLAPLGRIAVLIVGLLACAPGHSAGFKMLVFGDSLSAAYRIDPDLGWVNQLRLRLAPRGMEVLNASISGETTSGGASRITQALDSHRPDLLILELGGNDALRGLKLDASRQNLAYMITSAMDRGAGVLLLGMQIPPNYGRAYTEAFFNMYGELAEQFGTALVPFFLEPVALSYELMQADGIHPTEDAQALLLEHIWPVLSPLLPE